MGKETLYRGESELSALEDSKPEMNALETAEASIAEQVELLVMEVTRLEDKLSPVTEQNPVTASQSFGTSSHLKFLSKTHDIVEATKDRLQRLRNRLEM